MRFIRCPKCDETTEYTRTHYGIIPESVKEPQIIPNPEDAPQPRELDYLMEEYIQYLPCECIIPKKEHDELAMQSKRIQDNLL